ncbi:hypothetical protein ZWY2020_033745 [Hordeum vulgare]|nr:hypothetical protein ZWY2020_033745 [Hordeum vulgare]
MSPRSLPTDSPHVPQETPHLRSLLSRFPPYHRGTPPSISLVPLEAKTPSAPPFPTNHLGHPTYRGPPQGPLPCALPVGSLPPAVSTSPPFVSPTPDWSSLPPAAPAHPTPATSRSRRLLLPRRSPPSPGPPSLAAPPHRRLGRAPTGHGGPVTGPLLVGPPPVHRRPPPPPDRPAAGSLGGSLLHLDAIAPPRLPMSPATSTPTGHHQHHRNDLLTPRRPLLCNGGEPPVVPPLHSVFLALRRAAD